MNDLVRYPFGTISKSFYSVLPFGLFMSFAPPSRSFVFSLSPFFLCIIWLQYRYISRYCIDSANVRRTVKNFVYIIRLIQLACFCVCVDILTIICKFFHGLYFLIIHIFNNCVVHSVGLIVTNIKFIPLSCTGNC